MSLRAAFSKAGKSARRKIAGVIIGQEKGAADAVFSETNDNPYKDGASVKECEAEREPQKGR